MLRKIEGYIVEILTNSEEFRDCFLVEMKLDSSHLWVYMDSDDSLTLEKCAKISRKLESFIEGNGLLPDKYKIEVSSPGLSNPLKLRRQYIKNKGRTLRVKLEESVLEGKLMEVGNKGITLEIKMGKKELKEAVIAWEDIQKSFVQVSF